MLEGRRERYVYCSYLRSPNRFVLSRVLPYSSVSTQQQEKNIGGISRKYSSKLRAFPRYKNKYTSPFSFQHLDFGYVCITPARSRFVRFSSHPEKHTKIFTAPVPFSAHIPPNSNFLSLVFLFRRRTRASWQKNRR